MRVDFARITSCRSMDEQRDAVSSALSGMTNDDPVFLSDLIASVDHGGQPVLVNLGDRYELEKELEDSQKTKWKILVMRDEWGNVPGPGQKVVRKVMLPFKKSEEKYYTGDDLSRMKRTGEFSKRFERNREYTVDSKGCITCAFSDAMYFLSQWGVHAETGYPLTMKPEKNDINEISGKPVDAPNGSKLHVWYWRYKEITPEEYKKLPKRDKSPHKERGHLHAEGTTV